MSRWLLSETARERSVIYGILSTLHTRVVAGMAHSRLGVGLQTVRTQVTPHLLAARAWILYSRSYRWLTTEPEPDVIVIDLRDTYTVGPLIAALDRVLEALTPAFGASTLARIARAVAQSRIGTAFRSMCEPPVDDAEGETDSREE